MRTGLLWTIAFILSSIVISVSLLPTVRQFAATPANTVFLGTHNNLLDYPMFVSAINRGQRGKWTNKAVFTSEPQPPDLVHWVYIPLGKLTRLFNLNAILSYQLGRVIFALTLCLSSFYFITRLFPPPPGTEEKVHPKPSPQANLLRQFTRAVSNLFLPVQGLTRNPRANLILGSFILSLFSGGFTRISFINNQFRLLGPYLEWWTGGDTLRRTTFQPHAMLKNTLLFLILALFAKLISANQKSRLAWILPPLGLLLGLHDPINSLSIFMLLGLYILFTLLRDKLRLNKDKLALVKFVTAYALISAVGLYATFWAFSKTPWKSVSDWESRQHRPVAFFDYANHLGPVFYLGFPGLVLLCLVALKRKTDRSLPLPPTPHPFLSFSSLILTTFSVFMITSGFSALTGIATLRFFQTPVHVFLSIGTAYLLYFSFISPARKRIAPALYWISILLVLIPALPAHYNSLKTQSREWSTRYWNFYPDKESFETISYLKLISNVDDVVLANDLVSQAVPTVSGNIVFIGHFVSTLNLQEKLPLVVKFFSGKMDAREARSFVRTTGAKYILTLYPETLKINPDNYPFLVPVKTGPTLQLYQVAP